MNTSGGKRAVVIGAGLGGLSAAAALAGAGFKVTVCEKNPRPGGKLNLLEMDGFSFDMGPSILTLPDVFRQVFAAAGRKLEDYLTFVPVRPHWRNFFEDGTVFDLDPDPEEMSRQLARLAPGLDRPFRRFLRYSKKQYDAVDDAYFKTAADNTGQMIRRASPLNLLKLDLFRTMDGAVRRRLPEPHLRDVMDFFIKYVGSSALRAPAFMNMLPNVQFEFDLWYVEGGMYSIARALSRLLEELGVDLRFNAEVEKISIKNGRAKGVILSDGSAVDSDCVVSNLEVIPAVRSLLPEDPALLRRLEKRFLPACSGLVIHLGTDRVFPRLAHHNFFYSRNQRGHFRSVFEKGELPDDPTLYVVAPSRTDPSVCPEGCDNIKVLPHIPARAGEGVFSDRDYGRLKERVLEKLERMGLPGLRESTVVEHVWTPEDIRKNYFSNRGSIYGVATDFRKNYGFKAPKVSPRYSNLYFVGGSVNPGGGMPMVLMSGLRAAAALRPADEERK